MKKLQKNNVAFSFLRSNFSFLLLAPHPHPLNETSFSIERAKIEFHGGIRLKQKVTTNEIKGE